MKIKHLSIKLLTLIFLNFSLVHAQQNFPVKKLTIKEAIQIGLEYNKNLLQLRGNTKVATIKEKDIKTEQLPDLNFNTGFKILDNIHQFENGIFNRSTKYRTPREAYEFALDAEIPIYEGGKIQAHKQVAAINTEIEGTRVHMEERKLRLQLITAFLKVLHYEDQQSLINDKIREDKANIRQVKLMQQNGLVTSNEVLRTQLQLSNHKIALSDLTKEIAIIADKVKFLIGIDDDIILQLKTEGLINAKLLVKDEDGTAELALKSNEMLQIKQLTLKQHDYEKKIVRSNALPKISGIAGYSYTYPNFMFFPPTEYLYRFGSVGVKLTYPISGLYKNKQKMKIVHEQHHLAKLAVKEEEERTKSDLYEAQMKYEQALEKIKIAEEAIAQAAENYRIVKMKYTNQLSLITELIDADNSYLEARSSLISLKIDKQLKYYQLQYRLGNI